MIHLSYNHQIQMYSSSYDSIVTQINNVYKIASGIQIREMVQYLVRWW